MLRGGVASSGNQLFCGGVRNNPILIGANAVRWLLLGAVLACSLANHMFILCDTKEINNVFCKLND